MSAEVWRRLGDGPHPVAGEFFWAGGGYTCTVLSLITCLLHIRFIIILELGILSLIN
jgi:hypothetical protein